VSYGRGDASRAVLVARTSSEGQHGVYLRIMVGGMGTDTGDPRATQLLERDSPRSTSS
jgi:hypothetical protein